MNFNPKGIFLSRVNYDGPCSKFLSFKTGNSLVGRNEKCDIVIRGNSRIVSRQQCRFSFDHGKLFVENLSKSNYTYHNNDRVLHKTQVDVGDLIGLGTNPLVPLNDLTQDECFVYKCEIPEVVDLSSSDEENEGDQLNVNQQNPKIANVVNEVTINESSRTCSENDKLQLDNTKEVTNNSMEVDTSMLDPSENEQKICKPLSVKVTKLSLTQVNELCISPSQSTSTTSTLTKNKNHKEFKIKTDNNDKRKSLKFSRTKFDTEQTQKKIKRSLNQLVDTEMTSDEEQKGTNQKNKPKNSNKRKYIKSSGSSDTLNDVQPLKVRKVVENKSDVNVEEKKLPPQAVPSAKIEKIAFPSSNSVVLDTLSMPKTIKVMPKRRHTTHTPYKNNDELFKPDPPVKTPNSNQPSKDDSKDQVKRLRKRLKSVGECVFTNTYNPDIIEERRKKLKELSEKEKERAAEIEMKKPASTKSAPMKVKFSSENRGAYLTKEIPSFKNIQKTAITPSTPLPVTPAKSALEKFCEKHLETSKDSEKALRHDENDNTEEEDLMLNILPPTHDLFNQRIFTENNPPTLPTGPSITATLLEITGNNKLAEIPHVPYAPNEDAPTIYELYPKDPKIRGIIKNSNEKIIKKRVNFVDDKLETIHEYENNDVRESSSLTNINRKSLKELEQIVCEEILSWDVEWLQIQGLPKKWKNNVMKTKYESVDEYKEILKSLMRIELLSKLKNSNKTNQGAMDKEFHPLSVKGSTIIDQKKFHFQLELIIQVQNKSLFYRGLFVIIRMRAAGKDVDIFGYVSNIKEKDSLHSVFVEILYKDLPSNLAVVKCKTLIYIRTDVKSFVAVDNLQNSPLLNRIINPDLNKIKSCESENEPVKNLTEEQTRIVNVITSECLFNNTNANIIALQAEAGKGKTQVLIESIISIINCSKRDDVKCSILVCAMSNSCVDKIITSTYNHPSKHKKAKLARFGILDKINAEAQKLHVDLKSLKDEDVVFTTVYSAYDIYNVKKDFDVCFVDDASCCMDSELSILLQLNITKLILAGNIHQTQRMAQSEELLDSNYDETFFARMIKNFKDKPVGEGKPILMLEDQHRMGVELEKIVNEIIYSKSIISNNAVARNMSITEKINPFVILSWQGQLNELNINLRMMIISIYKNLMKIEEKFEKIGIIVHRNHLKFFEGAFKDINIIEVQTNDKLEGVENDVTIIPIINNKCITFLTTLNRLNSAMTRAKSAVYIIGHSKVFDLRSSWSDQWKRLLNYAARKGTLISFPCNYTDAVTKKVIIK